MAKGFFYSLVDIKAKIGNEHARKVTDIFMRLISFYDKVRGRVSV
jgi:hypothetical protein